MSSLMKGLLVLSAALALTACDNRPSSEEIVLRLDNGCVVHKIVDRSNPAFTERVYATICPKDVKVRTEWEETHSTGKTVTTNRLTNDTVEAP